MELLLFVSGLLIAIAESTLMLGAALHFYDQQELRRVWDTWPCSGGGAGVGVVLT